MAHTAVGTVKAVAQRESDYGILMGANWYNGKGKSPVNKGDQVSFTYEENEKGGKVFRNIKDFGNAKVISQGPPQRASQPEQPRNQVWEFHKEREARMARMSALKAITSILAPHLDMSVLEKINESEKLASKWAKWIMEGRW